MNKWYIDLWAFSWNEHTVVTNVCARKCFIFGVMCVSLPMPTILALKTKINVVRKGFFSLFSSLLFSCKPQSEKHAESERKEKSENMRKKRESDVDAIAHMHRHEYVCLGMYFSCQTVHLNVSESENTYNPFVDFVWKRQYKCGANKKGTFVTQKFSTTPSRPPPLPPPLTIFASF